MNTASTPITVEGHGRVQTADGTSLLILTARLEGHDSFLAGTLTVGTARIAVRVMTFDDTTVLLAEQSTPDLPTANWNGTLRLRHGSRHGQVPSDLADTARARGVLLSALDEPEMRYATTYLGEASTPEIRQGRINAILAALPTMPGARP